MAKESGVQSELFRWLREENLPEKEIPRNEKEWFREIAIGFSELGMEKPDLSEAYKEAEEKTDDEAIRHVLKKQLELGLVDYNLFRSLLKGEWSEKYGFGPTGLIQSIDFVCVIGKKAWVLEGKKEPNHEAIGQALVYKDLFEKDYTDFEEVHMGIVCKEPHALNEPTARKLGISILSSI